MLIPSSFRGLAPCALSLAILLSAVSCAPENPMRQAAVPAPPRPELRTPGDVFREGEDTAGVRHVLAVLKSLQSPDRGGRRVSFEFSEAEISEYLAYSLRVTPRPGIRKLSVRLSPDNAFSVRTIMDFTAIRKWHSWILPDALKAIASSEPVVEMDVKFEAHDGYGTFKLKSVGGSAARCWRMRHCVLEAAGDLSQARRNDSRARVLLVSGVTVTQGTGRPSGSQGVEAGMGRRDPGSGQHH